MPESINQLIVDEVVSRLGNITMDNGYVFDASVKGKPDRDSDKFHPDPRDIYVEEGESIENDALFIPGNPPKVAYDMTIRIEGVAKRVDGSSSETAVTENQMSQAIRQALANNDAASWHTFGGNAINAKMGAFQQTDDPSFDGAAVSLVVTYRVSELDPAVAG